MIIYKIESKTDKNNFHFITMEETKECNFENFKLTALEKLRETYTEKVIFKYERQSDDAIVFSSKKCFIFITTGEFDQSGRTIEIDSRGTIESVNFFYGNYRITKYL